MREHFNDIGTGIGKVFLRLLWYGERRGGGDKKENMMKGSKRKEDGHIAEG